jgi:hypothetical protein
LREARRRNALAADEQQESGDETPKNDADAYAEPDAMHRRRVPFIGNRPFRQVTLEQTIDAITG